MKLFKKASLFIKGVYASATASALRFFLTLLGFSLGVYILVVGMSILENYYNALTKEIRIMPDNAIATLGYNTGEQELSQIMNLCGKRPVVQACIHNGSYIGGFYLDTKQERPVEVRGVFFAISDETDVLACYDDSYGYRLYETKLIVGRLLTKKDITANAKVAVIDEFTATLLFGSADNAIGKSFCINNHNSGLYEVTDSGYEQEPVYFKIVGVIEDNYYVDKTKQAFVKAVENGGISFNITANIIVPFGYREHMGEKATIEGESCFFIWQTDNSTEFDNYKYVLNQVANNGTQGAFMEPFDKQSLHQEAVAKLRPIRIGVFVVSVILMIISGLFCMSILFFSMKERVQEIGIRKAYGATMVDLSAQFILENIFIGIISIAVATALGLMTVKLSEGYILQNISPDYEATITPSLIAFAVGAGLLQNVIFTLLPSVRYSLYKVTTALRSE